MKSKSKLGWILLSGASLAALGAVSPAFAQDEEVSDEIVVTATGRTAAIQDVPIAVTAIGAEQLQDAGVNTLIDLRQVTPNLRIGSGQSQTSGTAAAIRGIGTGSDNPGFESAVGIFIDGVYRPRAGTAIGDMADVERIEILRGPQGTLYGKNTTAGAISVVTAGPDFAPGAWLEGTGGDFGLIGARFGFNAPLTDSFAVRFDGTLRSRDGYIDDITSGRDLNTTDRYSVRGQALWDISSSASLRLIVDSAETDEICCAAVPLYDSSFTAPFLFSSSVNLTQAGSIPTPLFTLANVAYDGSIRETSLSPTRSYGEQSEDFGISGQLDWDLGGVNLTSITAYRDWESNRDQDIDFSAMDRAYRDDLEVGVRSFTQEIRLQGEWGRVNWLVGGFYGDETVAQTDNIRYGTQAGSYLNNLIQLFDFTAVGAPNANGALPGTGQTVFGCTPGAPGASTCAIDYVLAAFAANAAGLGANAAVPGTSGVLAGNIGLFSGALSAANIANAGQDGDRWDVQTESVALFTHNEIALTDRLTMTIGARWTQEEKELSADLNGSQQACDAIRSFQDVAYAALVIERQAETFLPIGNSLRTLASGLPGALTLACNPAVNNAAVLANGGIYTDTLEDDAISGTASLSFDLTDDFMIYGGYSRGYKSGGFNIDRSGMSLRPWSRPSDFDGLDSAYATAAATYLGLPTAPTYGSDDLDFEPETIDAYEIGFKSTIFGGSTTLNMAAYYQQLHDYQLNAFNGFNFITRNVPEVISQGVELELATRPIDGLTLTFGALYSDVYYDSTVVFGDNPSDVVRSGDPLAQSPEWTITGSVLYEMPVGDAMVARFYANGRYLSDYRLQTLSRNPNTDQEAFAIFDARIGLAAADDRWGIDFWVRNLTDEYYSIGAFAVPEQTLWSDTSQGVNGVFRAYPNEPQTMGVTLRARY